MGKVIEIITDLTKNEIYDALNDLREYTPKNPKYRLEGHLSHDEFHFIKRTPREENFLNKERYQIRTQIDGEIIERDGKRVVKITYSSRAVDKIWLSIFSFLLAIVLVYAVLISDLNLWTALGLFCFGEFLGIMFFSAGQENGRKSTLEIIKRTLNAK